jgi:putative membrane-bound dehydrogenase-like protein
MRSRCLSLLLALTLLPLANAQLSLDKSQASFAVTEGLEFKLWASEPLFVNPTCMDIDHLGRVWVCESVNYRNRLRKAKKLTRAEGDRIVILSDSKGTGKADTQTTFYQSPDIMAPLGIAVAKDPTGPGYKVFVCQSPDILLFEDKDGDGKADGPPKKFLTGFGGIDHDHGVHGILIGSDMKLYFSVGDSGVTGLQSSDGKGRKWVSNSTDCRAGTNWRCDLDGKNLELIAHNFRNQYEPCVDSFGNMFVSDNDDDGNQQTRICHVIPGGNYGYHPRGRGETHWHEEQPGVMPKILRTYFGSPTGMCVYEGKLLPKKYHGQLLHTDAGPRHVRAYHLKPKGASYEVDREDIVTSSDNWFRPSDVCVAPDGSVFVADWYDPGVGGHNMGDIKYGRIYRLAPKGHKYEVPKVDLTSNKGVIEALASPAQSVRYMAMAKLGEMKKEDAIKTLEPAWAQKEDSALRARALWQIGVIQGQGFTAHSASSEVMRDKDPRFLAQIVRMTRDFVDRPRSYALPATADLGTAREVLISLRTYPAEMSREMIYPLMKLYDGQDRHYLATIGIAVGHHDAKRREVILADFEKHFPDWNDKVAGLVFELRPPGIAKSLTKRLSDAKLSVEQRAKIVDIIATSDDKDTPRVLLDAFQGDTPAEVRARILDNLKLFLPTKWKDLPKEKEFTAVVEKLLADPSAKMRGLELASISGRADFAAKIRTIATDSAEKADTRKAAILALAQTFDKETLTTLSNLTKTPGELADAAITSIGEGIKSLDTRTPLVKEALDKLDSFLADKTMGETAAKALAASRVGTMNLLARHKEKKLPETLVASTGRLLRSSPYPDLQNQALIAFPPIKLDPMKLPPISVMAKRTGDVLKGKKILEESLKANTQCLKCHMVKGVGGQVGPDLSMIGKKASRENMIESILYPNKAIADQYITHIVTNDKGVTVQGLLVEETGDTVILRDAEGRDIRIAKASIESRGKSMKSLMPEDLVAQLSEDQLIDMVEYLLTLKTASLGVPEWSIIGPFDNVEAMVGLDKVYPPEKAIDPKASYEGKHGKVEWKTVKADMTTGYVDLKAHYGEKSPQTVSYLTREIESPADQDAVLLLGSDDGAKVWINGKLIHTSTETRAAAPEQNRVNVKLKKGLNRVLIKINNGDGPHGLYFNLQSEQELKLK